MTVLTGLVSAADIQVHSGFRCLPVNGTGMNNIRIQDSRSYLYNAEIEGHTLPYAVSEVQDELYSSVYIHMVNSANLSALFAKLHTGIAILQ